MKKFFKIVGIVFITISLFYIQRIMTKDLINKLKNNNNIS